MNKSSPTQLKPPECSQCRSSAEYYCRTCKQDLCVPCKEEHVIDFDTKLHNVVIDRLKYGDFMLLETCEKHPNMACEMWCLLCKLPICSNCVEHVSHIPQDIKLVYKIQQKQHQQRTVLVKSEIMLHNRGIQSGINSDFRSCQTEISKLQKNMIIKAERLKDQIDIVLEDVTEDTRVKLKCYFNSKQKQQRRRIRSIQKRVCMTEQLANRAIQFLLFFKETNVFNINDTPSTSIVTVHSLSEEINKANVFNCLGRIQVTETRKREVRNEQIYKVVSPPVLQKSFKVKSKWFMSNFIGHISCVTPDTAWVSSWNDLNLTDTTGESLHYLDIKYIDIIKDGVHTVTREGNLVYIDTYYKINKLSLNNKTKSTLRMIAEPWKPFCLYCSPLNGDFLIGMMSSDTNKAKVGRYNSKGQKLRHNPGQELYDNPRYITENLNGDVIVSDLNKNDSGLGVIVVTDSIGTHRFSFKGNSQGSKFRPYGICTDALAHILVCESYSRTVQIIDKDGQFLSVLLTEEQGIKDPYTISYDHRSHLLWVGSWRDTVIRIYRHIQKREYLRGNYI
ncbi:uncharacterized protein LOC133174754 [Saccostrea echinata]|uniref:uncharacterized protein LOC133174754 n=1 Tax=Saccostrea echinata TaxID=191078 RepID=UPI002A80A0DF|nr:uncharacterized protein LOC133174754 [Saccostrea echinata]